VLCAVVGNLKLRTWLALLAQHGFEGLGKDDASSTTTECHQTESGHHCNRVLTEIPYCQPHISLLGFQHPDELNVGDILQFVRV
jgi:hypothetical protein